MNIDSYLIALSAIVNQQTELMRAENEERLMQKQLPAYTISKTGLSAEAEILRSAVLEK
jgi:hypothetical protein